MTIIDGAYQDDVGDLYYVSGGKKYFFADLKALSNQGITNWNHISNADAATLPSAGIIGDTSVLANVLGTGIQSAPSNVAPTVSNVPMVNPAPPPPSSIATDGTLFGYPTWMVVGGGLLLLFLAKKEL